MIGERADTTARRNLPEPLKAKTSDDLVVFDSDGIAYIIATASFETSMARIGENAVEATLCRC